MKNKHLKSLNLFIETEKFYKFGGEGGRWEGGGGSGCRLFFLPCIYDIFHVY